MSKVLVTGATGFVGRHVVARLLERGHSVTALVREHPPAGLPWAGQVEISVCDIGRTGIDPQWACHDGLLHLAWPDLPHYHRLSHFESALPAHYAFIKQLVGMGLRQVLVTGTCFEYGMQSGCLAESAATFPDSPYALAKDTLRKFLQALQRDHAFTLQWARLFYMYGPGQNPKSLMAGLDQAIREKQATFEMSGGEQLRDYLPVENVASALIRLLENPDAAGIVNVCSGVPISVRTLVEQRVRDSGHPLQLRLGARPYSPHEPMAFWGDNARLASVWKDKHE